MSQAHFMNVYVLPFGKVEAGATFPTIEAAVKKAKTVECLSYKTIVFRTEGDQIVGAGTIRTT